MADNTQNFDTSERRCNEPVCIDAKRVYDSCGDKDCLSDLPVFLTAPAQELVDSAVNVRLRDCDVLNVLIDTEPVPFHRGFYSIDITYFFLVSLDVFTSPSTTPNTVTGVCVSDKKVILYGSEGNVRVFSSEYSSCSSTPRLSFSISINSSPNILLKLPRLISSMMKK